MFTASYLDRLRLYKSHFPLQTLKDHGRESVGGSEGEEPH